MALFNATSSARLAQHFHPSRTFGTLKHTHARQTVDVPSLSLTRRIWSFRRQEGGVKGPISTLLGTDRGREGFPMSLRFAPMPPFISADTLAQPRLTSFRAFCTNIEGSLVSQTLRPPCLTLLSDSGAEHNSPSGLSTCSDGPSPGDIGPDSRGLIIATPELGRGESLVSEVSQAPHGVRSPRARLDAPRRYTTMASHLRHGEFVGSLDCGTTSTRFMIFDRYANIVASHQIEFPQYYPEPGWHEHDADQIIESCDSCIEQACIELEGLGWTRQSVKVIGITNQRETTVAWSRSTGKPLSRAIVWDDARNKGLVTHYENALRDEGLEFDGKVVKGEDAVNALKTMTGLPISTYFSALKLRWMMNHWDVVREAHDKDDLCFGTVESWIVYKLTTTSSAPGVHVTDVSNASRTLLLDIRTLKFSPALLKFFGFRDSILPKVVSSSEVYGEIQYGGLKGVKIAGLAGDQQAALIGNKCLEKGEAKCTYGTGAFMLFCTGEEIVRSNFGLLTTVAYQNGPQGKPVYCLEGSIGVAGSAIKWLRDSMNMVTSASDVNGMSAKVVDTGGLYFVTAFGGLFAPYWDPSATGMIIGMSSYTTPSHVARATLEANAFMTRAVSESMKKDSGVDLPQLKVDGGMTNGDVVMSILADLTGMDIVRPEMRESTALGSALLAGSAVKLFGWDISRPSETLHEVNTAGATTFKPHMSQADRDKKWAGWQKAVERCRGWDVGVEE